MNWRSIRKGSERRKSARTTGRDVHAGGGARVRARSTPAPGGGLIVPGARQREGAHRAACPLVHHWIRSFLTAIPPGFPRGTPPTPRSRCVHFLNDGPKRLGTDEVFVRTCEKFGQYSRKFGQYSRKFGQCSRKFGQYSRKFGQYSRKFGQYSRKFGQYSRKFGQYSRKFGQYSRKFGQYSRKFGQYSRSFSYRTAKMRSNERFGTLIVEEEKPSATARFCVSRTSRSAAIGGRVIG